jgi:hypothetical protein
MEVICLQDEAFYTLVERLKEKQPSIKDKWISGEEAMTML